MIKNKLMYDEINAKHVYRIVILYYKTDREMKQMEGKFRTTYRRFSRLIFIGNILRVLNAQFNIFK